MAIFGISDPHVSSDATKQMDIFGWLGHPQNIFASWDAQVAPGDLVLITGDINWAMKTPDGEAEMRQFFGPRPGIKIFIRGNHDLWWPSKHKSGYLRMEHGSDGLRYGAFPLQTHGIRMAGIRAWDSPPWCPDGYAPEDEKIYRRDIARLATQLAAARDLPGPLWVLTHYPPLGPQHEPTALSELCEAHGAVRVLYGHLHGKHLSAAPNGVIRGVEYRCLSADFVGFALQRLG